MHLSSIRTVLFFIALSCFFTACVSNKNLTKRALYFRDISDSMLQKTAAMEYDPVLQKGDILYIGVITPNEKSSRLFNQNNYSAGPESAGSEGTSTASSASTQGYLIDGKGNITFPVLGFVKADGITKAELANSLTQRLRQYVDSAIVSVRLLNYRITVLGEVARPGTFSIPSERVSILDAIGLAGDLTVYGNRSNIRIIRTTNGTRHTATLDLNKGNIFSSPFFYLQQNDIVYIEMNDRKIPNTDQASFRNISLAIGIISAVSVVISTINLLK